MAIEPLEARCLLAVVPVTYGDLNGWQFANFDNSTGTNVGAAETASGTREQFVVGIGTPPLGAGSLQQVVGIDGDDAARFITSALNGLPLTSLTDLSYSTYVDNFGSGGQATYLQLSVDLDDNGTPDDTLFFEPVYQDGTYSTVSGAMPVAQPALALDTWQTWDADAGGWWSLDAGTFGPPLDTLANYALNNPGAKVATTSASFRLTAGFGGAAWAGFTGYVDNVTLNADTYDFENAPTTVYVDDDWAGTAFGADPDGTGPATLFGGDAFAVIQDGVDAVAELGTVQVLEGTYTESVTVDKTISLLGAQAGVDARTRGAVPESIVNGPGGSFSLIADGVELDGFTVAGTTTAPLGTGIYTSPAASGYQVRNNIIEDNIIGLYLNSSGATQTVVEQNLIRDNDNPGAAGGTGVYSDQGLAGVLIQNNRIAGVNPTAGINLANATSATGITISGNAFVDGNQLVLFNLDNSQVSGNTFTGSLPGGSGSAVFVGGGSDGLSITGNTFTNFGNRALSVSDAGFGPNANLDFSNNTIAADINLLPSGRALVDLNGVAGTSSVSGNSIMLTGMTNATVAFVHAVEIRGATTGTVNVTSNTLNGGNVDAFNGIDDSAGIRLRSTLPTTAVVNITNNVITGFVNGIEAELLAAGADVNVSLNSIVGNSSAGLINAAGATIDAACNWWGDITGPTNAANAGGSGQAVVGPVTFQPWLVYAPDSDPLLAGVHLVTSFTVPAQTSGFTATNNNYRRLVNAFDCLQPGQTMVLSGNFDWTETNAAAAWALGNDGLPATADDYQIAVRPNLNNVTVTAVSLFSAAIRGPGDLAAQNLEAFLSFNGGDNQNWTISNLAIFDFDLSIGMFNGAGGSDAYNNTRIIGNHIDVPADLNATVAPADVNQNIGIHFSFGTNQTIAGNVIEFVGNGVSDSANSRFATSVGMQSNTSGGSVYDGLLIDNNLLVVVNAQSADPQNILGIWENGHAHTSDITVSNNQFLNLDGGNNSALNLQRAFRVTSHSSATTTVTYSDNVVNGANIAFQWLAGSNFAGNQPVRIWGNDLTNNATGLLIQSNGLANIYRNDITGSGAGAGVHVVTGSLLPSGTVPTAVQENFIRNGSGDGILIDATAGVIGDIFDNDLSGNTGFGLNNLSAQPILAEFNWWGSELPTVVAAEVNGPVDFDPWLDSGEDTELATQGFQGDLLGTNSNDLVDLVLTKTDGADSVTPGTTIVYTLSYSNTGNLDATGVVITEMLPAGTTFNAAASTAGWVAGPGGTFTFNVGAVNSTAGGSVTFAVTVNNPAAAGQTTVVNAASIADDGASGEDRVPGDNQTSDTNTLVAAPDLVLSKSDGASSSTAGSTVVYVLSYQNVGNQNATGVVLTEAVPAGTTFNAAASSPGWTETAPGSGVYQLVVGALSGGAGGTAAFAVTVFGGVPAGQEQIENVASIANDGSNGADPTPANNIASDINTLDAAPDLVLSKTDNRSVVSPGSTVTYVLTYSNQGTQAASGVVLTDFLPPGTTFNPAGSTPGWVESSPGVFTLAVDDVLPSGELVLIHQVTFSVTVNDPVAAGQSTIFNVATISDDGSGGLDGNPSDNTATDTSSLVDVDLFAVGADAGGGPHVRVFNADGQERFNFFAFAPGFGGGVRVALGDVTGDGTPDIITAAGPGGGPHVRVFDGLSGQQIGGPLGSFFAYNAGFGGGVFVTAADFNDDGHFDIVTGADAGGGPHVRVFSGIDGSVLFELFDHPKSSAGVRVATGDIDADGTPDVITAPGPGVIAEVRVFSGSNGLPITNFVPYGGFGGGVYVAGGDVNGDGRDDIVTGAGAGGGPHVKAFSGLDGAELASFFAYNAGFRGGVRVAIGDIGDDGRTEILTGAGPGAGPHVKAFALDGSGEVASFFAFDAGFGGGVFVAGSIPDSLDSMPVEPNGGPGGASALLSSSAPPQQSTSEAELLPPSSKNLDTLFADESEDDWSLSDESFLQEQGYSKAADAFWEELATVGGEL